MRIRELIAELEKIRDEYPDLDIVVDGGYRIEGVIVGHHGPRITTGERFRDTTMSHEPIYRT